MYSYLLYRQRVSECVSVCPRYAYCRAPRVKVVAVSVHCRPDPVGLIQTYSAR